MLLAEYEAIQTYDDQSSDLGLVRFIAPTQPAFQAGQFVVINDDVSHRSFFGVVSGPNRNFNRDSLSPLDSKTVTQLQRLQNDRVNRNVIIREFYVYDILLIRDISNGSASSVRRRPQIGSVARPATADEIMTYLGLPEVRQETRIGALMDTDIPLCVSDNVIFHHQLVAGATGSGKSNVISNVVLAARNLGFAVIVLDHKPDYQNIHEINDERGADYLEAIDGCNYWYIGKPSTNSQEISIYVAACELDPVMLAATIFHQRSENNPREEFQRVVQEYAERHEFWEWSYLSQHLTDDKSWGEINKGTRTAAKSRLRRLGRIAAWFDDSRQPKLSFNSEFLSGSEQSASRRFDVAGALQPGNVSVIRVGASESGRDYGLLISYVLNGVSEHKASNPHETPPVMFVIDEAQDIFCSDESLRDKAVSMLEDHIRVARSKGIGFVIGVQSADAVPNGIMQNLNTRVVLRHNGVQMVRTALTSATEAQRNMTNTFGPGEALIQMQGAVGIVHAKMRRSPFKLTKNGGRR